MAAQVARPSLVRLPALVCACVALRAALPRVWALSTTKRLAVVVIARHARWQEARRTPVVR